MVLTRSAKSNMENTNRTTVGTTVSSTLPVYTIANTITTTATRTPTVTPAVQQFISMAQERSGFFNESAISNSTITSPDYSSAAARHVQEEYRGSNPPPVPQPVNNVLSNDTITPPEYSNITARTVQYRSVMPPVAPQPANNMPATGDMITFMREELQRQMQLLRTDMQQEIAKAVSRAIPSTPGPQTAVPLFPAGQQDNLINQQQQQTHSYIPGNNIQPPHNFPQSNAANTQPSHGTPTVNPVQSSQAPSWPTEGQFTIQRKVDLSKWGIKFDGTSRSMSAEDFIFRVDVLRQDYNCAFNDLLRCFHTLLEGQALDWYWTLRKLSTIQSWDELVGAFLTQFRRYGSEFQLQKQIMDRRQMPQENFESFYNAVMRLRNQQRNPYSERDLVEIMKSNLKPSLSHLLFAVRTDSLNDFCQQAKRAENLINTQRQSFQSRTLTPARVHELQFSDETPIPILEIDAMATSSRYTCWNCKQPGHSFMDCPSTNRRVFCFKCGRDNVVTPNCPKCQGNLKVSESQTGETRSTLA